ncbi:PucR family transcriptional regulator ligand-binding domain-containing protein [Lachnospiraceae bacterium LCP25S3_G4]
MAVKLESLYNQIRDKYDVKLMTESCFDQTIGWTHIIEDKRFISLLHGDELIFNTGVPYESEEWLYDFIMQLHQQKAGGLVIGVKSNEHFSDIILDYCNEIRFPLFASTFDTPYIDIMRIFSTILLKNEQRDITLNAAMKNAIYYPEQTELYLNHLERYGFYNDMSYVTVILSCLSCKNAKGNQKFQSIQKALRFDFKNCIVLEENDQLAVIIGGEQIETVIKYFSELCGEDKRIYGGVGTKEIGIQNICQSLKYAKMTYELTETALPNNFLVYDNLGIFKLLSNVHESRIYSEFVQDILGTLLTYDEKNHTDYLHILKSYFDNDCSLIHTSQKLYCHKNTLSYKMNKIKEILGYDIHTNQNRTKIMVAYSVLELLQIKKR